MIVLEYLIIYIKKLSNCGAQKEFNSFEDVTTKKFLLINVV